MPVAFARARWLAAAVLLALPASLSAQETDNSASLDLFIFNQEDNDGGNPFENEEFFYFAGRMSAKLKVSEVVTFRPTVGGSQIATGRSVRYPSTVANSNIAIRNATTTAASSTNITVAATLDIKPEGTDWTVSPGIFFAYEPIYVSRGLDLTVSGELFNGDFIPSFSYGVRYDTITGGNLEVAGIFNSGGRHDISPDGVDRRYHSRFSHNLQLGFTQILSPEWRINAGLQYTRQDGFLSYPNAKVVVYDGDTPVRLVDERLPDARNRLQANLRVRYSPALGFGLGMDHSGYADDWGILHGAIEPNAEGPFVREVARWRVWYRYSYQQGARYLRDKPQRDHEYRTADSDFGTFSTHGGGALFHFTLPRFGGVECVVRVSGYGVTRSDGIWGMGALLGTEFGWCACAETQE